MESSKKVSYSGTHVHDNYHLSAVETECEREIIKSLKDKIVNFIEANPRISSRQILRNLQVDNSELTIDLKQISNFKSY